MLRVLFLAVSLVIPLTLASACWGFSASDRDGLTQALISHGFENVVVTEGPEAMVSIYYENRIYRYQLRAMGVVMALVDEKLSPPWTATIIPLKAGVPVLSVTTTAENYKRFASGELDQKSFAASLIIKDDPPSPDLSGSENASFRRIDLSAGPTFTLELEQLDDSLRSRVNIVPQIETTLAKGLLATGQLVIPVVEEIEEEGSGLRPGRVTLDWLHRLGPAIGLFRAGMFDPERYGLSIAGGKWAWDGKLLLTAKGDLTGQLALIDGVWEYSAAEVFTYCLGAQYRYPLLDVAVQASFGRFLGEEEGARLDILRTVGEVDIGFFAIKTKDESLGGILVDLPLPLARYSSPSLLRFKTVPALTWEYRSTVTRAGWMPGGGLSIERLYKGLAPTFIRNNISEWMYAQRYI